LAEAPSFGEPIIQYDVLSTGAQSYLALAEEMLERDREDAEGPEVGMDETEEAE